MLHLICLHLILDVESKSPFSINKIKVKLLKNEMQQT